MTLKDKQIAVIMGGNSAEREISLLSGKAIEKALKSKGYNVICFDVDNNLIEKLLSNKIKTVFLALHGTFGEDGRIQGMLDILNISYNGSGVLASALAMNKVMAKIFFKENGLPTPVYQFIKKEKFKFTINIDYPIVIKPVSQGSACGVNIVSNKKELKIALKEAFALDNEVLIEEYIPGRELTVSILGNKSLPVVEIVPCKKFYDYEAKYTKGMSDHIVPAKLTKDLTEKIQKTALAAHRSLGCRDYSRVDIRLNDNNDFFILEVNTLPGMTDVSLFPDAAKSAGIEFPELIEKILKMAIKRQRTEKKNF